MFHKTQNSFIWQSATHSFENILFISLFFPPSPLCHFALFSRLHLHFWTLTVSLIFERSLSLLKIFRAVVSPYKCTTISVEVYRVVVSLFSRLSCLRTSVISPNVSLLAARVSSHRSSLLNGLVCVERDDRKRWPEGEEEITEERRRENGRDV